MIKELTEQDLKEMIGVNEYESFCKRLVYSDIATEDFKTAKGKMFFASSFYKIEGGNFLLLSRTIDREKLPFIDFGIILAVWSDNESEITDLQLDIYNSVKNELNGRFR